MTPTVGLPRMHKEQGERRDFLPDLIAPTESLRSGGASPRREEDVDDLPELVDGREQLAPGPADLQIRFTDVPACGLGEIVRRALLEHVNLVDGMPGTTRCFPSFLVL